MLAADTSHPSRYDVNGTRRTGHTSCFAAGFLRTANVVGESSAEVDELGDWTGACCNDMGVSSLGLVPFSLQMIGNGIVPGGDVIPQRRKKAFHTLEIALCCPDSGVPPHTSR